MPGEKRLLVTKKIEFEGYFVWRDLFRQLDFWLRDKFYDKFERRNEEFRLPSGRVIEVEMRPWKKVTDFYKLQPEIFIKVTDLKDVEIEKNGKKFKVNHGKFNIIIKGFFITDFKDRWNKEERPMLFFLRELFDQYVYKGIVKKYETMCYDDMNDLYNVLRAYLNMHSYKELEK